MSKGKEMYKKEGKFMPFPGTRDFNPVTGEDYSKDESGLVLSSEDAYLAQMARDNKLKEDEETAIAKYNEDVLTVSDEFKNINLVGAKILFRPFKLSSKDKSGFYRDLAITEQLPNTESKRRIPLSFPLQYEGVVCAVSDECPIEFRDKVKVGDIITIQSIAWQQQIYNMNRDVFQELEEPFTFWLTPGHVQAKIENTNKTSE